MGVIYKLKDEVVDFLINQRQENPLFSCRQLAEIASEKFSLKLSKSSVHEVLKESGITTPRGRKPKDKFKIPTEKKKQIQVSLAETKLLTGLSITERDAPSATPPPQERLNLGNIAPPANLPVPEGFQEEMYPLAGRLFEKAVLWDLGISSCDTMNEFDWDYYLTYPKGIKIVLANNQSVFIDLPLPLERCVRETVDTLVNNIRPLAVDRVSDWMLLERCLQAHEGFEMRHIEIVGDQDQIFAQFDALMRHPRTFHRQAWAFAQSQARQLRARVKDIFFPGIDQELWIEVCLGLSGFTQVTLLENHVTLIVENGYQYKHWLEAAVELFNKMGLRDESYRHVQLSLREKG